MGNSSISMFQDLGMFVEYSTTGAKTDWNGKMKSEVKKQDI